ncbi:MAG: vitamin K epoxide reductase family protein [Muribaculaceae bacterium]|nr:vitamin K epoxide reductase family protein [Muribaculaceae bacterium]
MTLMLMDGESNFILSDFLGALGVPHTPDYTTRRFEAMPFKSLFGLGKLLDEYGVSSLGLFLSDRSEIKALTPPFLAHTPQGFLIVTSTDGDKVSYLTRGVAETMSLREFCEVCDGNVFLAFPSPSAAEPDYASHARFQLFGKVKRILFVILAAALFVWLFVTQGIWRSVPAIFAVILNCCGLALSFMLVRKSLRIKSRFADKVCGVLQKEGCDTVLETGASSFFGIFSWSEVGLTYFSVSLLSILMFPGSIIYVAACNVCCLPFTLWSIWYQKFRAKAWCTLCVSVQCTLWLLFFSYLAGGWLKDVFPLKPGFFVLVAVYGFVLLGLNRIIPMMNKLKR